VLVEFAEPPGMFRFLALERRLGELLGVKVELVTRSALKPYIGQHISASGTLDLVAGIRATSLPQLLEPST